MVEDGDGVVDDLRAVRANSLAPRAQARDRRERGAAEVAGQQHEQVFRRRLGRTGMLELQPRQTARELQLPQPLAVLEPVSQRHSSAREAVVRRVVVGRDEEARLDRLTAELGQAELLARTELHLALDRFPNRHHPSLGAEAVKRR